MDKTLLERLQEARYSNEPAYVSFFNNGDVKEDERLVNKRMDDYYLDDTITLINYTFCDAAETYARDYPYDSMTMELNLGLVFNKKDIDQENHIKENATPLQGIVRCYTGDITSYLNGEKSNIRDYRYGKQGFVDYNVLVSKMRSNGITFEGPENFEMFKEAILSGERFGITLSADLNKEQAKEETKEETIIDEPKKQEKPKRLAKIPSFFQKKIK